MSVEGKGLRLKTPGEVRLRETTSLKLGDQTGELVSRKVLLSPGRRKTCQVCTGCLSLWKGVVDTLMLNEEVSVDRSKSVVLWTSVTQRKPKK